ncbi:MAG TPA: hypothetical protein PKE31_10415 [Pseudomonadota bacterium]|nr:hypothetical protein [Pseudomonadota bacterium]
MPIRIRTHWFVWPLMACLVGLLTWRLWGHRFRSPQDADPRVRPAVAAVVQSDAQGLSIRFEIRADEPMDDGSLQGAELVNLSLALPDGTRVRPGRQAFQPTISGGLVTLFLPPLPTDIREIRVLGQLAVKNVQGEELERLPLPTVVRW